MRKRAVVSAAETDAFTGWRHVLCYLERAGVKGKIKKGARRRERREGKHRIRRGEDD